MTHHATLLLTAWVLTSCGLGAALEPECLTSDDCTRDDLCRLERCVSSGDPNASPTASITVTTSSEEPPHTPTEPPDTHANTDAGHDVGPEGAHDASSDAAPPEPCGPHPEPGDLVLNELLVHVPPEPDGDANGDGLTA